MDAVFFLLNYVLPSGQSHNVSLLCKTRAKCVTADLAGLKCAWLLGHIVVARWRHTLGRVLHLDLEALV